MKTTHIKVLVPVTESYAFLMGLFSAIALVLIGLLIGINHRQIAAAGAKLEPDLVNKAMAATEESMLMTAGTVTKSSTLSNTSPPPPERELTRAKAVASYTVVTDREIFRVALETGIYELPDGTFVEVLGQVAMPHVVGFAADKFNATDPHRLRYAGPKATEACNAPDTADGKYWDKLPDGSPRLANACRFVKSPPP